MTHKEYMKIAIQEAYEGIHKKDGIRDYFSSIVTWKDAGCGKVDPNPLVGAVIVKDGKIIGKGHNRVLLNKDATCHGEMEAIRDASRNIGSHDLSGAVLYTTAAPCPMCKGAILWANIDKVYYGCTINDTDNIGFRDEIFYDKWNDPTQNKNGNYGEEVEREACMELFHDYVNMEHNIY